MSRRQRAWKPDKMANSMMSPLAECWERGFRALLWRLRPEHLQSAVAEAASHVANEVDAGLGLDSGENSFTSGCGVKSLSGCWFVASGRLVQLGNQAAGPHNADGGFPDLSSR